MSRRMIGMGPVRPRPEEKQRANPGVMVVRVLWNEIVQKAEEIPLDSFGAATFVIGEDPAVDFLIPKESLDGMERFELATVVGSSLTLNHLSNMSFRVMDTGDDTSFRGDTPLAPRNAGQENLYVEPYRTGVVTLGPWAFEFRLEDAALPPKSPIAFDTKNSYFFGFSLFLHAIFLFVFYLVPPEAAGLSFDETADTNKYVKVMLGVQEAANQVQQQLPAVEKQPEAAGGKAHADVSGEMGDRQARRTNNRSALKGPPDNMNPHMKKEALKEMAATGGIFALLAAEKMPVSPFGLDTASGFDPENALGALMGDDIGSNLGYGGLGLKGTGRGGGGDGRNTIGVGSFGRIAWTRLQGTCTGPNCDFGGGGQPPLKKRQGARVKVGTSTAKVVGALSKTTIRRIVRRHLNEIKFCYEKGLQKRPDLAGRVSVKFLIEPTGGVKTAAVASSTTGDLSVDRCIAETVARMVFPMPKESGIVIVTYPFTLASSEG